MTSIEYLLGLKPASGSRLALVQSIQAGLPVSAFERLVKHVAPTDAQFGFRLIPKATLDRRRRSSSQRLTSEEGDRLARLAKVFSFALDVFGDEGKARDFLGRPHPMLDDQAPLDVAVGTSPGTDAVINILGRTAYGGGV